MNDPVLEELISAYVDGELTPEEHARVERALNENERCRQMHDDFLAMRAALQSAPRERLDAGFRGRVMERIRHAAIDPTPVTLPSDGSDSASRGLAAVKTQRTWGNLLSRPAAWAAAAAILLAIVAYPLHRGLRLWIDGDESPPIASPHGEDLIPENNLVLPPDSRVLATDRNKTERKQQDDSASPENVAANDPPPSKPPVKPDSAPSPEDDAAPQMAQNIPPSGAPEDVPPKNLVAAGAADLVLDYGKPDLHIVRLGVSPEAMRTGALDVILEKNGVYFHAGDSPGRPEEGELANAAPPKMDLIFTSAHPEQIDRVLAALEDRPQDFRPAAVYSAPWEQILTWIVAEVEKIPEKPTKKPVAPRPNAAAGPQNALAPGDWSQFLALASASPPVTVFAYRAPPLEREELEKLFPAPRADEVPANAAPPVRADQLSPDAIAYVFFVLELQP